MTSPKDAIDALERQVRSGALDLRGALEFAWQHGCAHSRTAALWPAYDVRRIGLGWAVVRVIDGHVVGLWSTAQEAHDAFVLLTCSVDHVFR